MWGRAVAGSLETELGMALGKLSRWPPHSDPTPSPPPWFQSRSCISPALQTNASASLCHPPACGLYPALPGPREEEEEEETEEEEEEDAHQFCCPASECSSPSSR